MTRHEKDARLYGSDFDFYRDEKIYDRLGRHQDKLSSLDYLSPEDSEKLLKSEREQLNKTFEAVGRKLDAVGYVGGRAWGQVCDKFLGRTPESNLIRLDYEALHYHKTEATRADEVLRGVKYDDSILPRDIITKVDAETEVKKADVSEGEEKQKSPDPKVETVAPVATPKVVPQESDQAKEKQAFPASQGEPVIDTVDSEADKKTDLEVKENRKAATARVEQAVVIEAPRKLQKQQRPRKQKLPTQDFQKFVRDVERAIRIEDMAKDVLGAQNLNTSSSNSSQLRFGRKGGLSVELKGQHAGFWNNWENDEKGGPLKLIQNEKGLDFNGALAFASTYCCGNISNDIDDFLKGKKLKELSPAERQAQDAEYKAERLKQEADTQRLNTAKVQNIQALVAKALSLTGTPSETYLRKERGIQGELPDSLKYISPDTPFNYKGKNIPIKSGALLSVATDHDGEVKAIQITQLTGDGKKAVGDDGIKLPKKTYGVQKGSFVELQKGTTKDPIILAEGIETALSVKEAGIKGTVLCSLGTANIGNLDVKDRDVIIAADWDGSFDVQSWKATEKAKVNLEAKGNTVSIILPVKNPELTDEKVDFNDLLKQEGIDSVIDRVSDRLPGVIGTMSSPREPSIEESNERQENHNLSEKQPVASRVSPSTDHAKDQDQLLAQMDEKAPQEAKLEPEISALLKTQYELVLDLQQKKGVSSELFKRQFSIDPKSAISAIKAYAPYVKEELVRAELIESLVLKDIDPHKADLLAAQYNIVSQHYESEGNSLDLFKEQFSIDPPRSIDAIKFYYPRIQPDLEQAELKHLLYPCMKDGEIDKDADLQRKHDLVMTYRKAHNKSTALFEEQYAHSPESAIRAQIFLEKGIEMILDKSTSVDKLLRVLKPYLADPYTYVQDISLTDVAYKAETVEQESTHDNESAPEKDRGLSL